MCYAVWSFMIYLQLPFILFLHFHDLFKREEFMINKLKKSNTKKPGEKNLLSKCHVTPPNSEIICGQNVSTKVVCGIILFFEKKAMLKI